MLLGFVKAEDSLTCLIAALKFGFLQLLDQNTGDTAHLREFGATLRAAVVFLALLPLLQTQLAEQVVALPARLGILHDVLADKAFKVVVEGRQGLVPIDVLLLVVL